MFDSMFDELKEVKCLKEIASIFQESYNTKCFFCNKSSIIYVRLGYK